MKLLVYWMLCLSGVAGNVISGKSANRDLTSGAKTKLLATGGRITIICFACEFIATSLQSLLSSETSSTTLVQWEHYMTEECNDLEILPPAEMICEFSGELLGRISWAVATTSPRKMCEVVGDFCAEPSPQRKDDWSNKMSTNQKIVSVGKKGSPVKNLPVKCLLCEAAVFSLEKIVLPNVKSADGMVKVITDLCNKITRNNTMCLLVGTAIGQQIWKFKQYPPAKACEMMNACPNKTFKGAGYGRLVGNSLHSNTSCSVCREVVKTAKVFIISEQNVIEKDIINLICHKLPPFPAQACELAVKNDLPDLLEKYLDPDMICGLLQLC